MEVIIREATINDVYGIAKVHVDSWNTTYKDIVPEEYLKSRTYKAQEERWLKRFFLNENTKEFIYVAVDKKNEVVGFVSASPSNDYNDMGTISAIYILKEFQEQGIGKKLVKAATERLYKKGISDLLIWALEDNPSCSFYEHIGGKRKYEKKVNFGGKDLIEVGFVWEDIEGLLKIITI